MNKITSLSIQVGENELSRHFVWYNSNTNAKAVLQYATKSAYENDGDFNAENSVTVFGTCEAPFNNADNISCKVRVENLLPDTEYVYRVGSGVDFDTNVYTFKTQSDLTKSQTFNLISDLHMKYRTAADKEEADFCTQRWQNTLEQMLKFTPDLAFIISVGDHISSCNMGVKDMEQLREICEQEHKNFFAPALMKSIPLAAVMGNHEAQNAQEPTDFASVTRYHFDMPDDNGISGHYLNNSMGNFYFMSGEVLFIGIHANAKPTGAKVNTNPAIHREFIAKACNANPTAKWRVLINHIPVYSYITNASEEAKMREFFGSLCDEFNIDVAFTGHSHAFSRSKHIYAGEPLENENKDKVTNPKGTLYYNIPSALDHSFTAVSEDYLKYNNAWGVEAEAAKAIPDFNGIEFSSPMFVNVCVKENSMMIKAVRSDNLTAIDTYTIHKIQGDNV